MDISAFKKQCQESIKKFESKVLPLKYIDKGILPSEAFAFCAMSDFYGIDIIIESGTAGGFSTEVFARYFNKPIYSIDNSTLYGMDMFNETKERLSVYKNVELILGESYQEIKKLLARFNNKKIAIFIDGPKGWNAMLLAEKCFFQSVNVSFIGAHDLSHDRNLLIEKFLFYTDDTFFTDEYFYINHCSGFLNTSLKKQLSKHPNGPVIGFFERNSLLTGRAYSYSKTHVIYFLYYRLLGLGYRKNILLMESRFPRVLSVLRKMKRLLF